VGEFFALHTYVSIYFTLALFSHLHHYALVNVVVFYGWLIFFLEEKLHSLPHSCKIMADNSAVNFFHSITIVILVLLLQYLQGKVN